MMRFRYVGPEERVSIFGAEFVRGEAVSIAAHHAAAKLARHPEFELADPDPANQPPPVATGGTDPKDSADADTTPVDHVGAADPPRARRRGNPNG